MHSVFDSCGRMSMVPASMSSRSASTTAGICASSQTRSQSGMYTSGFGISQ